MTAQYPDTQPYLENLQIQKNRNMPGWKKLAIADGLNETVKPLAFSGIKQRHPDATPEQVHRLLAEAVLGKVLEQKVYGNAQ